jgi:hypothetical protein
LRANAKLRIFVQHRKATVMIATLIKFVCPRLARAVFPAVLAGVLAPPLTLADTDAPAPSGDSIDWVKAREFWAFRSPQAQTLPPVQDSHWVRQRLDQFVLAALERQRLSPSPEAEKRILIRRVTFDLTGLPPTAEEVQAFLSDKQADAYEKLVERLLASPRFGERMASLWLNVARYAEDQAHQVGADNKNFYPNAWRYRQWVTEAFNRDLPYDQFIQLQLAADQMEGTEPDQLPALGFVGLGPKYYNRDRLDVMSDEWEDRVDTVTRSFLGLTVACARCHDHKYDPITTGDYYALAGVFASTKMVNKTQAGEVEEPVKDSDDTKKKETKPPNPNLLHIVEDGKPQDLNVFIRGNVERKGPVAERRFLRVLSASEPKPFLHGSGRAELAAAIANRANPLTARVMVNRLWALIFGRGLVATPSNFGAQGQRPTHPELLDDLAVGFMDHGWSVKELVREMVLSSTYRQSSHSNEKKQMLDPDNQYLWRMNRRHLPVEMWRDAFLAVTGELDPTGGPSLELDDPKNHRRTVYARISRLKLNDLLMQFDYPDANVHAEKRSVTTTATQKLFVLNSPFMLERAKSLAAQILCHPKESDTVRIRKAYQRLYGRPATTAEVKLALEFLGKTDRTPVPRWEQYAQTLLAANEMMCLD